MRMCDGVAFCFISVEGNYFRTKLKTFEKTVNKFLFIFLLVFSSSLWVTWTGCLFLEHRLSASISFLSIPVSLADLSATERGLWIKLLCVCVCLCVCAFFSFSLCFHQILKHIHVYTRLCIFSFVVRCREVWLLHLLIGLHDFAIVGIRFITFNAFYVTLFLMLILLYYTIFNSFLLVPFA